MFEDIDWETYFPVRIINLDKDLYLTAKLSEPVADERRKDILFAFLGYEKADETFSDVEIIKVDDSTLTIKANLKNNMIEDMGEILPLLNEVTDIAEITVGEEKEEE